MAKAHKQSEVTLVLTEKEANDLYQVLGQVCDNQRGGTRPAYEALEALGFRHPDDDSPSVVKGHVNFL